MLAGQSLDNNGAYPMKRIILISIAVLALIVVAVGVWGWTMMQKPLYEPGLVRAGQGLRAPLVPPEQTAGPDWWVVESDVKLYHWAAGQGRNVLVVHGGPGYPFAAPLPGLEPLTSRYRFHYYDQRGCGQSSRPIDRFSSSNYYENMKTLDWTLGLGAQIADIERIRQILGEDKLIMVGHSFGGFLASLYAAEFPEHTQALILVAPAETLIMPPEDGGLFEEIKPLLPEDIQSEYAAYLKRYLDDGGIFAKTDAELASLNAEFARYYAAAAARKGFTVSAGDQQAAGGGWMVQAMYMSMGMRHDYRAALAQVKAPVLVVHGENDLQPEKGSRQYAAAFPNAAFQTIKNAGHFPFDEQPQAFARLVGEFLGPIN